MRETKDGLRLQKNWIINVEINTYVTIIVENKIRDTASQKTIDILVCSKKYAAQQQSNFLLCYVKV